MSRSSIPVLTYHSVAPGESIDPVRFEKHLAVLARSGLPSLSPADLDNAERGFLLTFDDGFSDLWTHVLPLLEEYSIHATVFVIPSRVGDGPPRDPGTGGETGAAQEAHRETARGCAQHPRFLRWSELEALESSGRVTVMSHSNTHRMGWVGDQIRGFHLGRHGGRYWYLAEASGGDERLGIPVYRRGSALAHRLYLDDRALRDFLANWLETRGGEAYIAETGRRRVEEELRQEVEAQCADHGSAGCWEEPEARRRRTLEEIATARDTLEQRLGGVRDELCLPWGEYDEVTLDCAREAGVRRVYTLDRGANPAGDIGFLVNRFEPRARGKLWLRSRLWLHGSVASAELYRRMARR